MVAATTALDYFANKPLPTTAKAFSAIANARKVFSYSNNHEQMLCLNGLKVISLFWIILLHEYSIFSAGPVENLRDLEIVRLEFQLYSVEGVLNCLIAVERVFNEQLREKWFAGG